MNPQVLIFTMVFAAIASLLLKRWHAAARAVAVGTSGFTAIAAADAMARAADQQTLGWLVPGLDLGPVSLPLDLGTSRATAAVAFAVALVAAAVQVYSTWYLRDDDRYPTFAATVSLFTAAMLLLVHSHDLVLTLIGWEVMGWCSYLLIGHWSRKPSARRAAYKAFLVTRVADIGFVLGTVGLIAGAGTSSLEGVIAAWGGAPTCDPLGQCTGPDSVLRAILLTLLVVGVLGKSAQVPFQDWLPDAMEGPTPASALIHAATMVAAGTVVLAALFPVFAQAESARWVLGVSTAITMLLAALLALGQSDLKRLLAWSTVSQVAIMLSALASAPAADGPDAGLFHLWSHALFKSLLFLSLGLLGVVAGGTAASLLRGVGTRSRLGRWTFLIGLLSLAGVPFLVGGLSKEHVLAEVYAGAMNRGPGLFVLCSLLATVVVTAAYSTRAFLVIAQTANDEEPATDAASTDAQPNRTDAVRRQGRGPASAVLVTLALLTLIGGLVLILDLFTLHEASWIWLAVTVVLISVGCGLAFALGRSGDPGVRFAGRHGHRFDTGFGADTAYRALARAVVALARGVAFLDTEVIDGFVRGSAVAARVSGGRLDRAHRAERPRNGAWLVVAGLLALLALGVFAWR